MIPLEPDPLPSTHPEPLIAVIDSCVFPRRDWLDPILRAARSGYVIPIWSPLIIAEVTRFLTWQWLQRHNSDQSAATWQACSTAAKSWFTLMTAVFRIAEDCPPPEDLWDSPRDEWDVPIWSAAKRCGAHIIVTANLRDGPPEDERGRRSFQGVLWCHPDNFPRLLERWADLVATDERASQDDPEHTGETRNVASGLPRSPRGEVPQLLVDLLGELYAGDVGRR